MTRPPSIRLVALASLVGTAIEWYDFYLYGTAAALIFNRLYFPTFDPLTGTLAAFGTYAVRFRRAADRRNHHRPLRRQSRPKIDARADARHHGACDVRHRAAADLRADRAVGRRRPRDPASGAGVWRWRRVGRRRAHGRGTRAARVARLLWQLASDGRTGRTAPVLVACSSCSRGFRKINSCHGAGASRFS